MELKMEIKLLEEIAQMVLMVEIQQREEIVLMEQMELKVEIQR